MRTAGVPWKPEDKEPGTRRVGLGARQSRSANGAGKVHELLYGTGSKKWGSGYESAGHSAMGTGWKKVDPNDCLRCMLGII